MKKYIKLASLALIVTLIGCSTTTKQKEIMDNVASFAPTELPETDNIYDDYANHFLILKNANSYTAGVRNNYVLTYSDGSSNEYSFDGIIEAENINANPSAHLSEYINGNGLQSTVDGYYYDGRLYNNYNGVTYYEDMDYATLVGVLQTPINAQSVQQSQITQITKKVDGNETKYIISLLDDASYDLFLNRYDVSGISSEDSITVQNGVIEQSFDSNGYFTGETAKFHAEVTINEEIIQIDYSSSVSYIKVDETTVLLDDSMKEEQASYVAFEDIDLNSISDSNIENDAPGASVTETFQKRLINRLKYTVQEDGTYITRYNENESYVVDFANHQFTYTNYSSTYVYNWQGDTGVFGSYCTYDFNTEQKSTDCDDSTIEMIKNVKLYFELELYYCGLSLDDFVNE